MRVIEAKALACVGRAGNVTSGLRAALLRLGAVARTRSEVERQLAGAADRFALERRERDWSRGDGRDGSLLGR